MRKAMRASEPTPCSHLMSQQLKMTATLTIASTTTCRHTSPGYVYGLAVSERALVRS